jgi:SNF2 family DNA or RNA helicase
MTKEQKQHYQKMLRHFVTEMAEEGTITAVNEAVKLQKLVQIACGVAYGDDGRNIELDCSPRVNIVKEVIDEVGGKVIVFVPLTGTLRMLERELSKDWTVGVVNGEVSAKKRNEIFQNFQNSKDPHVLIAHPATMAHGLTLTSASTVIWYGPVTSNEQYVQANGRIERIGKKHVSNVVHIEATEVEYRMYERLKNKQKLQGILLDLIQQETR